MKRIMFILGVLVYMPGLTLAGNAYYNNSFYLSSGGDTLVLDLQAYPKDTLAGGYWNGTYEEDSTSIHFGEFVFSHSSGWGGMYWDGFTYATNGDNGRYGVPCSVHPCDETHSEPWINHQWGVMAGGGIKTISENAVTETEKGIPYLLAYWGYYQESLGGHSLEVHLDDQSLFAPQELYISAHPWPYWGNIYGDGFARPLKQEDDYFKLWIHAIYDNNSRDSIEWTLAEYDPNEPDSVYQEAIWQYIDISAFGSNVRSLYFTMETTDADPMYGPNTAVYFCMDKLKVVKQSGASLSASSRSVKTKSLHAFSKPILVKDKVFANASEDGMVFFYDTKGEKILQKNIKAGNNQIDISTLPAGEYLMKHSHRSIFLTVGK